MISSKCWLKYMELFKTSSPMFYHANDGSLMIEADGRTLIQPENETDESFMERLNRCTKEHNVFLEEWEEFKYEPDCIY